MDETRSGGSQEDDDFIEDLVAEILGHDESRIEEVLNQACLRHPERAEEIRARLELLRSWNLVDVTRESSSAVSEREHPPQLGRFQVLERLGSGGMGVVYLAIDPEREGERVAIKCISPDRLLLPGARARFMREVEAIARLEHPGILPILSVGEESGVPYFAMELVRGLSLADVIEAHELENPATLQGSDMWRTIRAKARLLGAESTVAEDTPPLFSGSWSHAAHAIARAAAEALQHAHERGVIHRDIKPSNIMVTSDGRVLLVDFGLARTDGAHTLTQSGTPLGSLPYMSPEQARGDRSAVDQRTDIYSLGVTLYELLSLRRAFEGESSEELRRRILSGHSQPLRRYNRSLSRSTETVCQKAMARERDQRYFTAEELRLDLDRLLQGSRVLARPPGLMLRVRRFAEKRPALSVGLLVGAILVSIALSFIAWREFEARARLEEETQRAVERYEQAENVAVYTADLLARLDPTLFATEGLGELRKIASDLLTTHFDDKGDYFAYLGETLATAFLHCADHERAEELLKKSIRAREDVKTDVPYKIGLAQRSLARVSLGQGQNEEALVLGPGVAGNSRSRTR